MSQYFRAVAIDFDGTLSEGGPPSVKVMATVGEARSRGLRILLVTGRILAELRSVFPEVDRHFDAIVAENGAALAIDGSLRLLSAPVDFELDEALVERAVPFRRGQVLLATHAGYANRVQEEIQRLGLECQLVYNRGELMILPPGVSKGLGLVRALDSLGLSPHNTIGVGDAENDHSLLGICETGVAVANAVDGLKRHADVVLEHPGGEGVTGLLQRILQGDTASLRTTRWLIELGRFVEGGRAAIPGSQINLLIAGGSKAGKSFVGGAFAERLIELGYSVCIIDPEGDYVSLGQLHGVECLAQRGQAPDIDQVRRLLVHRFGSVIVDLSLTNPAEHASWTQRLLRELARTRRETGLPHWIIVDEAHHALGLPDELLTTLDEGDKGYCLVTYQPQLLAERLKSAIDVLLVLPGGKRMAGPDPLAEIDRLCGLEVSERLQGAEKGQAALVRLTNGHDIRLVTLAARRTEHVRHWHKYLQARLPPGLRFVFRKAGEPGGTTASNVEEFRELLRASPPEVVATHAERSDFSRWIAEALQDEALAQAVRPIERKFVASNRATRDIEALRLDVGAAVRQRYVE
jgi:hydroxymethylpyrimidine pyrophosphatase-like HAD family hydrolase